MVKINNYKFSQKSTDVTNQETKDTKAPDSCASNNKKSSDKFEKDPSAKGIFNKTARKTFKKIEALEKVIIEEKKLNFFFDDRAEIDFIKEPKLDDFFSLCSSFEKKYRDSGQAMFFRMDSILIDPKASSYAMANQNVSNLGVNEEKLERWTLKEQAQHEKDEQKTRERVWVRNEKIMKEGKGVGGHLTGAVLRGKTLAYTTKNRGTIRGNMFNLNSKFCGKSIEEMLPRYGSRKGKHIAVRVSQFTLNTILTAVGYGCAPVSFGVSIFVSQQAQVLVTLTGEVLGLKFDGAKKRKMISHASIRGVQLEMMRIPFVGSIINYGENIVFGTAAGGIVITTLADWILESMSERYTSSISIDDLGDPSVLFEMNQRIDYLSRFLLPYGQYLLLNEKDVHKQKKLKKILKENFKILKSLEHQSIKALNFYRLALIAGRIPKSIRPEIEQVCQVAEKDIKNNTHRTVRQCLGELMRKEQQ